jgi:hypothetical protein
MSLLAASRKYDEWKKGLEQACEQLLAQTRSQLVAAQSRPEADEKIERAEQLLRAKLEPVLLEHEAGLEPIGQEVASYFEHTEEPSEQDAAVQERIGQGIEPVRERLERRIASLVAQARAAELVAQAPGPGAPAAPAAQQPSAPAASGGPAPAPARSPAGGAATPPPGMRRFCVGCGGKLGPAEWTARRCPQCGAAR